MICEKCQFLTKELYVRCVMYLESGGPVERQYELECRMCKPEGAKFDYIITEQTVEYANPEYGHPRYALQSPSWLKHNTKYNIIITEEGPHLNDL